jgi:hypothetical protein
MTATTARYQQPGTVCTERLAAIAREIEKLAAHVAGLESNQDWNSAGSLGYILETLQNLNAPK